MLWGLHQSWQVLTEILARGVSSGCNEEEEQLVQRDLRPVLAAVWRRRNLDATSATSSVYGLGRESSDCRLHNSGP